MSVVIILYRSLKKSQLGTKRVGTNKWRKVTTEVSFALLTESPLIISSWLEHWLNKEDYNIGRRMATLLA